MFCFLDCFDCFAIEEKMGRNEGKRRQFGEGISRKGQKKLRLRHEAMTKAREILGTMDVGERAEEDDVAVQVNTIWWQMRSNFGSRRKAKVGVGYSSWECFLKIIHFCGLVFMT